VGERRADSAGAQQLCQRIGVDAVRLQLDGVNVGSAFTQRAMCGRRWALDDCLVPGRTVLEQERVGLHRAVRDENALGSTPWCSAIQLRRRG
jgi:hypothetical protein